MSGHVLVAWYSHSGHSKAAAAAIASALGADLERIEPLGRGPKGLTGFIRAGFASLCGNAWPVKPLSSAIESYGLVVICAPVWAGRLAPPARGWLNLARPRIKAVAACATVGGTKGTKFFSDVETAAGKSALATAVITEEHRKSGADQRIIDCFIADLAWPAA